MGVKYTHAIFALMLLAVAGCGNSDQTTTTNTTTVGPAFSPSLQLLRLTPQNANDAASTLTGLEAQTTSLIPGPVDGSNGTPMGVIQNLLLAYPLLSQPQGPSASLQVSGNTVTFHEHSTPAGRLSGRVALTPATRPPLVLTAELQGLRVTPSPEIGGLPRSYQLDGTATLSQTPIVPVVGLPVDNDYGFNVTVTDLATGGTARLENFTAEAVGNVTETTQSGLLSTHGEIVLDRFQGFTGQVTVTSPAPIGFTAPRATASAGATPTSGEVDFTGDGVLAVSVPTPGNVVISLNGAVIPQPSP